MNDLYMSNNILYSPRGNSVRGVIKDVFNNVNHTPNSIHSALPKADKSVRHDQNETIMYKMW